MAEKTLQDIDPLMALALSLAVTLARQSAIDRQQLAADLKRAAALSMQPPKVAAALKGAAELLDMRTPSAGPEELSLTPGS